MTQAMLKRYPYVLDIFYCTAFFVYNRALLLLKFTMFDIIGFLSYELAFALIESIVVAFLVVILLKLMPIRQIRDHLSIVGGLILFSVAISMLIFKERGQLIKWISISIPMIAPSAGQIILFLWLFATLGLPIVSVIMIRNVRTSARIKSLIESLSILAGVYITFSVIGILIVIYRNLQ
jgi:hypothetical protein